MDIAKINYTQIIIVKLKKNPIEMAFFKDLIFFFIRLKYLLENKKKSLFLQPEIMVVKTITINNSEKFFSFFRGIAQPG